MRLSPKALPAILGILALFIGAWSVAPHNTAFAQGSNGTPTANATAGGTTAPGDTAVPTSVPTAAGTATPGSPALVFPPGTSANEKAILQSLYNFNPDISTVTAGSLSATDRTALDVFWAENASNLQMLRVGLSRARTPQLRAMIRLMYQMHLKDQLLLNQLETQVGGITSGTATPVATTPATAVPTASATTAATVAPTTASTTAATMAPTTGATTAATSAATAAATSAATGTPAANHIGGGNGVTPPVSLSQVPILPNTPLGSLGFRWINLTTVFLNKIKEVPAAQFDADFVFQTVYAHSMAVDTAVAVQTSASNPVIQALAKHLADEEEVHLVMMQVLTDQVFFHQSLKIDFPTQVGVPNQPTPGATESVTPVPSGTGTAAPDMTGGSSSAPGMH